MNILIQTRTENDEGKVNSRSDITEQVIYIIAQYIAQYFTEHAQISTATRSHF